MRQGSLFDEPPTPPRRPRKRRALPPTLDAQEAATNRDDGIARADAAASDEFKAELDAAIYRAAETHERLICDALYEFMPPGEPKGSLHSVGAAMQRARRAGWIAPTDEHRPSAQVQCNKNPRRVWQSLIYRGKAS